MTHVAEAEKRMRASDYGWQQATDVMDALGALREATLAQAHATLALAAATAQDAATPEALYCSHCGAFADDPHKAGCRFGEGCPAGDPVCETDDGGTHDACTPPSCPTCGTRVTDWPSKDCETPDAHTGAVYDCDCGDVVTMADALAQPTKHRRCHLIGGRS